MTRAQADFPQCHHTGPTNRLKNLIIIIIIIIITFFSSKMLLLF
jgi:hypothetical protein